MITPADYVHGYDERANRRLADQARALSDLLHADTAYSPGSRVLEVGCGVGAQTVILATNSPEAQFTSVDVSEASLAEARTRTRKAGLANVTFHKADVFDLPFPAGSFDHVFVCFLLEHLADPGDALGRLRGLLRTGGSLTVIEGDHGSAYFHPDSYAARLVIECQIELQRRSGGNANVGRQLYPLIAAAGYRSVHVTPRMVYVDSSRPSWGDEFTESTFTAMVEGIRDAALQAGLLDARTFDDGIRALRRTKEGDGVFCYTFFKATAQAVDGGLEHRPTTSENQ